MSIDALINSLIIIGLTLFVGLTAAAYVVLAERRICAFMQQRLGPNRVGPFGLLQPLADAIKLLFKEDIVPTSSNRYIHALAPMLGVLLAVAGLALLPLARGLHIADVNIGVLYSLGIASVAVYSITLAGWSSNSKYSLLGGLRSSAQMLSYEIPMGICVVSIVLLSNHFLPTNNGEYLRMTSIVEAQSSVWFVFVNPLTFLIFFVCALAETNRVPFDLVEAEQELVGGYHTEYSSMKFGSFFLGEYLNIIISSALMTTLFLGGYLGIGEKSLGVQSWGFWPQLGWGLGWFCLKTFFLVYVFIWVRWTLPRFKYNQLMDIGWKVLLPLSLLNLMVLAFILLLFQ